jgi:hypothetical protein
LEVESGHDFGRVPQGETLQYDFVLRNDGDSVLEINEVRPSCGCTTTGDWPHTLQPGQSGTLPVRVETAHFVGPIIKTIAVVTNDATRNETTLELRANIWTEISVANPVLIFPPVGDPNETTTRATTIRGEVEGPLKLDAPQSDNPHFKARLKEVVPDKEYELTVTTVPPLAEGTQSARITMHSSNPKSPQVAVQAVATVLPAVQVAPSEFSFTAGKLQAKERRYAVVLLHRNADLQVADLKTDAPGVTLTPMPNAPDRQFTIAVDFPAGFEIHPGQKYFVRGKTNQPTMPTFQIPILAVRGR